MESNNEPTDNLLGLIYSNASTALNAAELLRKNDCAAYALHFSIICWEECSKYLLAYCKDHLPAKQFKDRYSHISKYSLASGLYFLSGGFSVIYLLQELHESGEFEEGPVGLRALVALSLRDFGWGDAEALANSLIKFLTTERTNEQKITLEKTLVDVERLRTQSVYVDFGDDLTFQGGPSTIPEESVLKWIENARLGVGILNFLRSEHPDFKALVASMPETIRAEVQAKSDEMIAHMKDAKSTRAD